MLLNFLLGLEFKNMPPCKSVLLNKIKRANSLSQMIKTSSEKTIDLSWNGWFINENNELEIEYFTGNPFPEIIITMATDNIPENQEEEEDDTDQYFSSDDDEENIDMSDDNDDDWNLRK